MTESTTEPASPKRASVWALTDDRPGNNAQVLGVAQALGWPTEEKALRYSGFARLPNILRGATLAGVSDDSRPGLCEPWPDLVISAGRRSAPVARWIKTQSGGLTKLVHLMFPGRAGGTDFDLLVVPDHDDDADVRGWSNVLEIVGAPTLVTSDLLETEAANWRDRFDALPRPFLALIVGGATKRHAFAAARATQLGRRVSALAKSCNGSVLLATSRRTGTEAEQALVGAIPEPRTAFLWSEGGENPYLGYLALADVLIVTGDSVTMCAEACATTTPVYIDAPQDATSAKHARLHDKLYQLGYARPLSELPSSGLEDWSHSALTPTDEIVGAIQRVMRGQPVKG